MATKIPKKKNEGEEQLARDMRAHHIKFQRQYRAHPEKRWLIDFYVSGSDLLIEVDGGNAMVKWSPKMKKYVAIGHHIYDKDYERIAELVIQGYRVLRFTPNQVKKGYAIEAITRALS